jgi:hypothetical protein
MSTLDLHKKLLAKKAEVLGTEKPEYKTNGEFRPSFFSQRGMVNIKVTSDESTLLEIYKFFKHHVESAKELGLDPKHLGYTVDEWLHDVKLRVAVLKRNETLADIAALEKEIEGILTTKEKKVIKTDEIKSKLEKL